MPEDSTLIYEEDTANMASSNNSRSELASVPENRQVSMIKNGIWLYLILLIIEGALRKWFLPFLASPLLIVRDPIAMWLIIKALQNNLLPRSLYLTGMVVIGCTGFFTAVFFGHGNLFIALYGARILLLHFPLIFVIGAVFTEADVIKMGKAILWVSLPMTLILGLQFYSPQSAWINHGIGENSKGAGFSGALGFFRPSGTFSFTSGVTQFYSLLTPFVLYFWFAPARVNRLLLILATLALMASVPFSISRSLLFQVVLSLGFLAFATVRSPKQVFQVVFAAGIVLLAFAVLSNVGFFHTATKAFSTRISDANTAEGGVGGTLVDRYLGALLNALVPSYSLPFFGYGIGLGTNVASSLLTGGRGFLIAEDEWPRTIGEMGLLLGLLIIFIRLSLAFKFFIKAIKYISFKKILPWLLLSYGLLIIPQGEWAQPTVLGFSTVIAGLILASFNVPSGALQTQVWQVADTNADY